MRYYLTLILLLLLPLPLLADQFQVWTGLRYTHPFKDSKFSLFIATENRFRDEMHYFLFNTTTGFQYTAYQWMSIGFAVRYQSAKGARQEDDFADEYDLMPQIEFTVPIGKVVFKNRQIFESRFLPDEVSNNYRFRYRCRFLLARPIPFQKWTLSPYVSEEFFVEPETNGLNQNRVAGGSSFIFWKDRLNIDVYYLYRTDLQPNNSVFTIQAVGTSFGIRY